MIQKKRGKKKRRDEENKKYNLLNAKCKCIKVRVEAFHNGETRRETNPDRREEKNFKLLCSPHFGLFFCTSAEIVKLFLCSRAFSWDIFFCNEQTSLKLWSLRFAIEKCRVRDQLSNFARRKDSTDNEIHQKISISPSTPNDVTWEACEIISFIVAAAFSTRTDLHERT